MKKVALIVAIAFISVWSFSALAQMNDEYEKGLKYYNTGQFEEAVKHLKSYVEKNPRASAYYLIGYSLYKLGRHDEADEYFREAYLIDTEFSPTQLFEEEIKDRFIKKEPEGVPVPSVQPEVQPAPEPVEEMRQGVLSLPSITPKTAVPTEPETVPEEPMVEAEPEEPEIPIVMLEEPVPEEKPQPEITFQPPKGFPEKMPRGLPGLIVGLGIINLIIVIGILVFQALCIFLIAKKLDVAAAWTAWIPLIQIWPIVGSAGKPWWWILLLFIPLVNIILFIYLWMLISENLGKNKLLGLLMLIPLVNFIFMGYLAFSD